jgi:hypothetical protein
MGRRKGDSAAKVSIGSEGMPKDRFYSRARCTRSVQCICSAECAVDKAVHSDQDSGLITGSQL